MSCHQKDSTFKEVQYKTVQESSNSRFPASIKMQNI